MDQIGGTIQDWQNGTATVETQYRQEGAGPQAYVTLTSGVVDADGRFSLTQPDAATLAPYLTPFQQGPREGCAGEFKQSAPNAGHFTISGYALRRSDGSSIGFLVQERPGTGDTPQPGDYFIQRIYSSRAGTVTGTLACPTLQATLNLNLKAGWTAAVFTYDAVTPDGKASAYTLSTPAQLPPTQF